MLDKEKEAKKAKEKEAVAVPVLRGLTVDPAEIEHTSDSGHWKKTNGKLYKMRNLGNKEHILEFHAWCMVVFCYRILT